MFSKFLLVWRFVQRAFYIGSLRVKHFFAWQERWDKMSLALNEPKYFALHSTSNITSEHAPEVEKKNWYCIQNNQWKCAGDQLLIRSLLELKDNSTVTCILIFVTLLVSAASWDGFLQGQDKLSFQVLKASRLWGPTWNSPIIWVCVLVMSKLSSSSRYESKQGMLLMSWFCLPVIHEKKESYTFICRGNT